MFYIRLPFENNSTYHWMSLLFLFSVSLSVYLVCLYRDWPGLVLSLEGSRGATKLSTPNLFSDNSYCVLAFVRNRYVKYEGNCYSYVSHDGSIRHKVLLSIRWMQIAMVAPLCTFWVYAWTRLNTAFNTYCRKICTKSRNSKIVRSNFQFSLRCKETHSILRWLLNSK